MLVYYVFLLFVFIYLLTPYSHYDNDGVLVSRVYPIELISIILIMLFAGLRYGIGTDYANYANIFSRISQNTPYNNGLEKGFLYTARFFNRFEHGFVQHILFISIITSLFHYLAIKSSSQSSSHRVLIYLMLFLTSTYFIPFNAVRQGVAIAISFYSFKFIRERKLLWVVACTILSYWFHRSGIILFFIYFLYLFPTKKIILYGIILFAFVVNKYDLIILVLDFILGLLDAKSARHLITVKAIYGSGLGVYAYVLMSLVVIFFYKIKTRDDKFLLLMFAGGISLRVLSLENIIFIRLAYYFTVFDILVIPNFILGFKERENRIIFSAFVLGVYGLLFALALKNSNGLNPYNSILFNLY